MGISQWLEKLDIARSKFGRQCVRIGNVDECVPAGDTFFDVSRVVRHWSYAYVFHQDLRTAPADDAEEDVVRFRPLKGDLKSKPISVKRKRGRYVTDDKKRRDGGNLCLCHVNSSELYALYSRRWTTPSRIACSSFPVASPFNSVMKWSNRTGSDSMNIVAQLATFFFPNSTKSDSCWQVT